MNVFYDYYISVFKSKYLKFSGRASRSEFWYFSIFNFIVSILFFLSDTLLDTIYVLTETDDFSISMSTSLLYFILSIIPSIALSVRRLQDTGKNRWWLLVLLTGIGLFLLIYFWSKAGERGHNKYGSSPWGVIEALDEEEIEESPTNILMEDDENPNVGRKIAKFIGITLLVLFILAGGILFFMGGAIFSMGKAIVKEVNNVKIDNTLNKEGNIVSITAPLKAQYQLLYKNLNLCTPKDKVNDSFFKKIDAGTFTANSMCTNNNCEISVSLENPQEYPKVVKAYLHADGSCQQQTLPSNSKAVIDNYEVTIEMSKKLLDMLDISQKDYKVSVSKTSSYNAWQVMGTKKISFYYEKILTEDRLLIDGVKKAKLIYTNKQKTPKVLETKHSPIPDINTTKAPEKPFKKITESSLTQEKNALEKELKQLEYLQEKVLKEEQLLLMKELEGLKK
jgi:uncharacterized membrane protein YhaH (DUF805 family)